MTTTIAIMTIQLDKMCSFAVWRLLCSRRLPNHFLKSVHVLFRIMSLKRPTHWSTIRTLSKRDSIDWGKEKFRTLFFYSRLLWENNQITRRSDVADFSAFSLRKRFFSCRALVSPLLSLAGNVTLLLILRLNTFTVLCWSTQRVYRCGALRVCLCNFIYNITPLCLIDLYCILGLAVSRHNASGERAGPVGHLSPAKVQSSSFEQIVQ